MIVSDGRTDREKLEELLGNPEQTHLDLKSCVDLNDDADKLKFVKDAVTMASRPEGGYILVGVDDSGNPCNPIGTIADRGLFDGACLGKLIRGYIEAAVHVEVCIHERGEKEIAVIHLLNPDGLPIPYIKDGQYAGADGRSKTIFRRGEIFVREGAENVPIRYAHWTDILSLYSKKIRDESTEAALAMLREALGTSPGVSEASTSVGTPLVMKMDEATFTATADRLLSAGNNNRMHQFIRSLPSSLRARASLPEFQTAADRWTIFCAQALYCGNPNLVNEAIDKLVDYYKTLGMDTEATHKRLMVVERIYVVGSLAIRLEEWDTVRSLALRPVPGNVHDPGYLYSSWIRAAQVYASRANLHQDSQGHHRQGYILSAARELIVEHPGMRPDLHDDDVANHEVTDADIALNSLCEFDVAYCFLVEAMGIDHGGAYPSSAEFDENRAKPMAQRLATNPLVRQQLFPGVADAAIAEAIESTYDIAVRESANHHASRWWGMPSSVRQFVSTHRQKPIGQPMTP